MCVMYYIQHRRAATAASPQRGGLIVHRFPCLVLHVVFRGRGKYPGRRILSCCAAACGGAYIAEQFLIDFSLPTIQFEFSFGSLMVSYIYERPSHSGGSASDASPEADCVVI